MDEQSNPFPPSFTHLKFPLSDAAGHSMSTHDPVSEVKRLYEDVEEHVERLRDTDSMGELNAVVDETTLPRDLRQDILSLYTLSAALIEEFAVDIIVRELVVARHRDKDDVREAFEKRGVSANVRLLLDIGAIENGLHGELQSVINDRNEFVHEADSTLFIEDYDEFLSRARRCKRATKKLAVVLDGEDVRNW